MNRYQAMMKACSNFIDGVGLACNLRLDVAKQVSESNCNKSRIDADVFFRCPKLTSPFPGSSEHVLVKFSGELERKRIQVPARESPALSFDDVLLFPFVQLSLCDDVRWNESGTLIRIEWRCALGIIEFQSHNFFGFSDRISSTRRAS